MLNKVAGAKCVSMLTVRTIKQFRFLTFITPLPCCRPIRLAPHLTCQSGPLVYRASSLTLTGGLVSTESVPQKDSTNKVPTESSLLAHLKLKISQKAVRKIVSTIEETEAGTNEWGLASIRPDSALYNTAIRALIRAERPDLAVALYRSRETARQSRPGLSPDPSLGVAVIRCVQRFAKKRGERKNSSDEVLLALQAEVEDILRNPTGEHDLARSETSRNSYQYAKQFAHAFANLTSVSLSALDHGESVKDVNIKRAVTSLSYFSRLSRTFGPAAALDVTEYNEMIRALGKARRLDAVFEVLDSMRACNVERDGVTFEYLANAAVKQVRFVTGAVSMDTLPKPIGSEVAFVGRSNVGKSSLVNMVCNRRALAYVSGRPGKTQQFNYFLVNERDPTSQFYIVDLPGVGYAKVPGPIQQQWLRFMVQYLKYRTSLRLVFHLIDGRHGALKDDEVLMQQMSVVRGLFQYVLVLTKMDKTAKQKVKQTILNDMRAALVRNGCAEETPIVLTSAQSKLGRDEMWRHLREAILPLSKTAHTR